MEPSQCYAHSEVDHLISLEARAFLENEGIDQNQQQRSVEQVETQQISCKDEDNENMQ